LPNFPTDKRFNPLFLKKCIEVAFENHITRESFVNKKISLGEQRDSKYLKLQFDFVLCKISWGLGLNGWQGQFVKMPGRSLMSYS